MTNIIVKKTDEADPNDRVEGMVFAGDEVNEWIKDNSEPAAEHFFDDVFDEVTNQPNFEFFLDTGAAERRLRPTKRDNVYRFGKRRRLIVKCEDDGQDSDRKKKMTIGVPEDRNDLLTGGYIDTIIDDLRNILHAGAPPAITEADRSRAKKYLLASIFLNRCH